MPDIFQELADAWKAPIVSRGEVGLFSGGLLNARTLANHDSLGTGPKGRLRIGRKVAYPVAELIAWMRATHPVTEHPSSNS